MFINYKETEGMSKFSECKTSNCIITGNEHFLERNGINLFDAIIVTVEGYKENSVKLIFKEIFEKVYPKIQQTKMLVTCQRFGDWLLFGLVWPYSSIQKNIMKVGSRSLLLTCSSNKL